MKTNWKMNLSLILVLLGTSMVQAEVRSYPVTRSGSGVSGVVDFDPMTRIVYWRPDECTTAQLKKDRSLPQHYQHCVGHLFDEKHGSWSMYLILAGLDPRNPYGSQGSGSRDMRPTTSAYCPEARVANPDDPWVSYRCAPVSNTVAMGTHEYHSPRVSILFNKRPVINDPNQAKPALMAGSIELALSQDSEVQLCQNSKIMRLSNAVTSPDFRQLTIYFGGDKTWHCNIETGANNGGESVLQWYSDMTAFRRSQKGAANELYQPATK